MIRKDREKLALLLRRLIAGRITNDDFEDSLPSLQDPAVNAIYREVWLLYDDLYCHKLTGKHAVPLNQRKMFARCILFLRSNYDYQWSPRRSVPALNILLNFCTLGWWSRRLSKAEKKWRLQGDIEVWPFWKREHMDREVESPKFLAGNAIKMLQYVPTASGLHPTGFAGG